MSRYFFFVSRRARRARRGSRKKLPKYHAEAKRILTTKVSELSSLHNFPVRKVFVKHQKTRWGSCSENNNINLNARLIFLRQELRNYVIFHELCHLRHMDHGRDFWTELVRFVPNARTLQKELRIKPFTELKNEGLKEAQNFDTINVVNY